MIVLKTLQVVACHHLCTLSAWGTCDVCANFAQCHKFQQSIVFAATKRHGESNDGH